MFLEAVFFVAKTSVCSQRCGHTVQIQAADVDHADTFMDSWYQHNLLQYSPPPPPPPSPHATPNTPRD